MRRLIIAMLFVVSCGPAVNNPHGDVVQHYKTGDAYTICVQDDNGRVGCFNVSKDQWDKYQIGEKYP